jgi:hypothetical protein
MQQQHTLRGKYRYAATAHSERYVPLCSTHKNAAELLTYFLSTWKTFRIGTWNVRTMIEAGKTAQETIRMKTEQVIIEDEIRKRKRKMERTLREPPQ